MTEQSARRRPIGWWLKTADARIDRAFEDAFTSQSITRREGQVLESLSGAPMLESELLRKPAAFAGAQDAVDGPGPRGLLQGGAEGGRVLTLTDAGQIAHGRAVASVATVRSAVSTALPGGNYATLLRPLADLVDGLDRTSVGSGAVAVHDRSDRWRPAAGCRDGRSRAQVHGVEGGPSEPDHGVMGGVSGRDNRNGCQRWALTLSGKAFAGRQSTVSFYTAIGFTASPTPS